MSDSFDPSKFFAGLREAGERAERAARRGMALVLGEGERLAKSYCPIKEGTLAATCSGDARSIVVTPNEISGKLTAGGGEASDYSIRQHEEPMHHTHPTEGVYASKYIQKAAEEVTPKMGPIMAAEVRQEMAK